VTLPFFADTDEQAHFDLVHKFARGNWPEHLRTPRDPLVWVILGITLLVCVALLVWRR